MFTWFKSLLVAQPPTKRAAQVRVSAVSPIAQSTLPEHASSSTAVTGRGLSFHADLIPKLLDDHRVVLGIYGRVLEGVAAKDWVGVSKLLHQFRTGLQDHLLDEAVRLYVYLQRAVEDEASEELIRGFRTEMERIGRVVVKTLDRFEHLEGSAQLQELFENEWRSLGVVLGDRIAREEKTLYPLYRQQSDRRGH